MKLTERADHLEQSLCLVPTATDIRVRMITEALRAHAHAALEAAAKVAENIATRTESHPMFPAYGMSATAECAHEIAAAIRALERE